MPIYEYQGKNYDIATDDPAEARRKIQSYLDINEPGKVREFGRTAASTADVALNAVTGTLDYLAYPFARAYYGMSMPSDQAAARAREETTSPKDMIGTALGITNTPQYQGEAARRGTQYVGEKLQPVIKGAAEYTGMPEADIESMMGTATMAVAPGASKAIAPVARGTAQAAENIAGTAGRIATAPVRATAQTAEGLFGGVSGRIARPGEKPGPLQTPSSRIPLGETFIDPEDWARFQRGEITVDQLQARPIQELPRNAVDRAALALAGNEMPAAGQGFRAFGEALGRQYKKSPLIGAIDIGLGTMGIPPPVATYRGMQALGDVYLSKRGFDPNLPQQLQAAQGQAGVDIIRQRAMNQPLQIPYNPTPAKPTPPGPIYVSPEGVAGTNVNQVSQAGAQQRYAPQPIAPQNIQAQVEAAAAQRVEQMPVRTPEQQAILEQIRARGAAQREAELAARARTTMGENYQPPSAGPVAPPPTLEQRRAALADQPINRLFEQEQPVAPVAPEQSRPTSTPDYNAPMSAIEEHNMQEMFRKNPRMPHPDNPFWNPPGGRPKNTLGMIVPENAPITKRPMSDAMRSALDSTEGTAAILRGQGVIVKDGIEYRIERVAADQVRVQARRGNQVIDEYYLK